MNSSLDFPADGRGDGTSPNSFSAAATVQTGSSSRNPVDRVGGQPGRQPLGWHIHRRRPRRLHRYRRRLQPEREFLRGRCHVRRRRIGQPTGAGAGNLAMGPVADVVGEHRACCCTGTNAPAHSRNTGCNAVAINPDGNGYPTPLRQSNLGAAPHRGARRVEYAAVRSVLPSGHPGSRDANPARPTLRPLLRRRHRRSVGIGLRLRRR